MRITHLVFAVAATAASAAAFAEPFGPIHVAANRGQYVGRGCPIVIVYTASINFTLPHPRGFTFSYHWERSDGAKGPVKIVHPGPNERTLVVRDTWKLGAPGRTIDASETIHIGSGNTHITEASPTVHVECR